MTGLYPHAWSAYLDVFLVFLRLLGLFLLVPIFSHQTIPPTIRLLLALTLSLALYPLAKPFLGPLPLTTGTLIAAALRETAIGFLMGFAAYLTFEAINLSAQFVGYQMGLGTAGLMDPQNHSQVSVWVPLQGWLALMVFLIVDGHHMMLALFVKSFEITSQAQFAATPSLLSTFVALTGKLFIIAVQMAAPFTLIILCVNAAVGVLARMLPQMNMLLFSFSITILLSFASLYLIAPEVLDYLDGTLSDVSGDVVGILKAL